MAFHGVLEIILPTSIQGVWWEEAGGISRPSQSYIPPVVLTDLTIIKEMVFAGALMQNTFVLILHVWDMSDKYLGA